MIFSYWWVSTCQSHRAAINAPTKAFLLTERRGPVCLTVAVLLVVAHLHKNMLMSLLILLACYFFPYSSSYQLNSRVNRYTVHDALFSTKSLPPPSQLETNNTLIQSEWLALAVQVCMMRVIIDKTCDGRVQLVKKTTFALCSLVSGEVTQTSCGREVQRELGFTSSTDVQSSDSLISRPWALPRG